MEQREKDFANGAARKRFHKCKQCEKDFANASSVKKISQMQAV
jgi:predicted PP-loop superfamily ATPase